MVKGCMLEFADKVVFGVMRMFRVLDVWGRGVAGFGELEMLRL